LLRGDDENILVPVWQNKQNLLNVLETTATAQKQKILAGNNVLDAEFISEFWLAN
jgi:hypothetical protein